MPSRDSSTHDYYVIAAMLLALLLFYAGSQGVWYWLTYDLLDGRWACDLIINTVVQKSGVVPLAGIEGRFVWSASTVVLLTVIAAIVSVSAYVLLTTFRIWRIYIGIAIAIILAAMLLVIAFTIESDYRHYIPLAVSGQDCALTDANISRFEFGRYLLLNLQPGAGTNILNGITVLEQLLPVLLLVCNLFLVAALIGQVTESRHRSYSAEVLARQFARFRLLLLLGSAMFTAISLYTLSQFGWFAQMLQAYGAPGAESLRAVQRGVTLYIGTLNSIAMIILFLPPGWILWNRAQMLCRKENPDQSTQVCADWLEDKQLNIFAGPTIRIIVAVAPLLVSGAVMLLEKALM